MMRRKTAKFLNQTFANAKPSKTAIGPSAALIFNNRNHRRQWESRGSGQDVIPCGRAEVKLAIAGAYLKTCRQWCATIALKTKSLTPKSMPYDSLIPAPAAGARATRLNIPVRRSSPMAIHEAVSSPSRPRLSVVTAILGSNSCTAGPNTIRKNTMPPSHNARAII